MSDFSSIGAAFSSLVMIVLTVAVLYFGLTVVWKLFSFAFLDASGPIPKAQAPRLRHGGSGGPHSNDWFGACWPFVDAKWKAITYGRYPESELWRPDLVFLIGSVAGCLAGLRRDLAPLCGRRGAARGGRGAVLVVDHSRSRLTARRCSTTSTIQRWPRRSGMFFDRSPSARGFSAPSACSTCCLVKPFGRRTVAALTLTVFPVLAYILLTGGNAEGGAGFWYGLAAIAAFGVLLWLIPTLFGDNSLSALILSLLILAVICYLLWGWLKPLSEMTISLPLPGTFLGKLTAGIGALALLFLVSAGRHINMIVRILLAVPAIVMIAGAFGTGVTTSSALPVGWVILALLIIGVLGFAAMAVVGMGRGEWHAAIGGFGRSAGKALLLLAIVVGAVAFVGGHWMVDLIELSAAGETGKFLSPEHIAAHAHHAPRGTGLTIPREVWPLPEVETNVWGGLLVTLVVALAGIVASLPLGVLLALGRRSQLPAVRLLSVCFIEFWRGVPLITVLFMSSVMLPLFLPDGVEFNKLLRALIGVALFSSAYMAEVVRGGLQAIPKGQYEGADSLGLGYAQKMRLIVMPQALTLVIPGIVNTFIGLFKDTVLVLIIGLFDLLGMIQTSFTDSAWAVPVTNPTGYLTAAAIFWIFCFGMSRYSMFMENRLRRGHSR